MARTKFIALLFSFGGPALAGFIGALATDATGEWYRALIKPALMPPNWVFAPVWTTLYILMGISAYLIWIKRRDHPDRRTALFFFVTQLAFNALWPIFFFGLHSPGCALSVIGGLLLALLTTILLFGRIDRHAALLLVPYLLWVGFATYLNASISMLNPSPW